MKKKLYIIVPCCVVIATALSLIFSFTSQDSKHHDDIEIQAIYSQYVAHADENGETPLSYEDWLKRIKGEPGVNGKDGLSAYQIWLNAGNEGTEQDFLVWLKGKDGVDGTDGKNGEDGTNGKDGLSAYEIWLNAGNVGTEQDFLAWLKGKDGVDGTDGKNGEDGTNGKDGLSAYEIWLNAGNSGTEEDFINSLKGADGVDATQCEHFWSEWTVLLTTCTTKVKMKTCEHCGVSVVESESGNWHNYIEEVISPTCGTQGYTLHYCENCGSNYKDNYVYKTDEHNFVELEVITSTCTERKVLATCSECNFNTVLIEETTVEHDYKVVKHDATCSEQGYTICTCKVCGYTDICNYVEPTGVHTYVDNICTQCGCVNNEAWDGTIATKIAKGNGTEFNPYLIQTGAELAFIAKQINGSSANTYYYKHYKLVNSIDLGGQEWTPIGNGSSINQSFRGVFDGNGFTISNFKITKSYTYYIGLFGKLTGCIIKNLTLNNITISFSASSSAASDFYLGTIAGNKTSGTIENCYSSSNINVEYKDSSYNTLYAGGIVGKNSGAINNTDVNTNLEAICSTRNYSAYLYIGGITGCNTGNIDKCVIDANIIGTVLTESSYNAIAYIGGVVGLNVGNILNVSALGYSYAEATNLISSHLDSTSYSGGIVGKNEGIINNAYSTTLVSSNSTSSNESSIAYAGGFVAYNTGEISNCFATGNVSAYLYTSNVYTGGFVGYNGKDATIDNCYRYKNQLFAINQNGIISNEPTNTIGNDVITDDLNSKDFYKITLTWDDMIWNFNEINFDNDVLPTLRRE